MPSVRAGLLAATDVETAVWVLTQAPLRAACKAFGVQRREGGRGSDPRDELELKDLLVAAVKRARQAFSGSRDARARALPPPGFNAGLWSGLLSAGCGLGFSGRASVGFSGRLPPWVFLGVPPWVCLGACLPAPGLQVPPRPGCRCAGAGSARAGGGCALSRGERQAAAGAHFPEEAPAGGRRPRLARWCKQGPRGRGAGRF